MSLWVNIKVEYHDQEERYTAEMRQGADCTICQDMAEQLEPDRNKQINQHFTLTEPDQIKQFAKIASNHVTVEVDVDYPLFSEEPSFSIEASHLDYLPCVAIASRERRLQHKDSKKTDAYHNLYAKQFNKGEAVFGARLKNIKSISFILS